LRVNEWQIAGTLQAMASLDQGHTIAHQSVKDWIVSWNDDGERAPPRPRKR
jgi:predicted transcriptional regulator